MLAQQDRFRLTHTQPARKLRLSDLLAWVRTSAALWTLGETPMPVAAERIRTLVVDDSPLARQRICSYLDTEPTVEIVGVAEDGADALTCNDRLRPDLVLLDLQMPGMNGLEVAARLSTGTSTPLVIIVTGLELSGIGERARECGVAGVVSKQRLSEELPKLLDEILPASRS